MKKAIEYLRSIEWSLGHGQCPECLGRSSSFNKIKKSEAGHQPECKLALAICDLSKSEQVLFATYWPMGRPKELQKAA